MSGFERIPDPLERMRRHAEKLFAASTDAIRVEWETQGTDGRPPCSACTPRDGRIFTRDEITELLKTPFCGREGIGCRCRLKIAGE